MFRSFGISLNLSCPTRSGWKRWLLGVVLCGLFPSPTLGAPFPDSGTTTPPTMDPLPLLERLVWFSRAGATSQARELAIQLQSLLSQKPASKGMDAGEAVYWIGVALFQSGHPEQAASWWIQVPAGHLRYPEARYALALGAFRDGRFPEGRSYLEEVLRTAPPLLAQRARLTLGLSYLDRGREERAISWLDGIPPSSPFYPEALLALGWSHIHRGEGLRALSFWEELREAHPWHPASREVLLRIGDLYAQNNAYIKAVEAYQKALERLQVWKTWMQSQRTQLAPWIHEANWTALRTLIHRLGDLEAQGLLDQLEAVQEAPSWVPRAWVSALRSRLEKDLRMPLEEHLREAQTRLQDQSLQVLLEIFPEPPASPPGNLGGRPIR